MTNFLYLERENDIIWKAGAINLPKKEFIRFIDNSEIGYLPDIGTCIKLGKMAVHAIRMGGEHWDADDCTWKEYYVKTGV